MDDKLRNPLIDELAGSLEPVRPLKPGLGLAWVAGAVAASLAVVVAAVGLRAGIGHASALFYIANGLLLMLGIAAASSVAVMATPQVGNRHDVPKWATVMAGVLPLAMLIALFTAGSSWHDRIDPLLGGWHCFVFGLLSGVAAAAAMVWWLRRGAPTSPRLAGLYTGIAAGALGSFTYGMSCAQDTILHLGSWHILPVITAGVLGWLALPRLLRW